MNRWHQLTISIRRNEDGYVGIVNPHILFEEWTTIPIADYQYSLVKLFLLYDNHFSLNYEKVTTNKSSFMAVIYKPRIPL